MPGAENRPWFGRTVIRSCCKLDYSLAQRMIDGTVTGVDADPGGQRQGTAEEPRGTGMGMGYVVGE